MRLRVAHSYLSQQKAPEQLHFDAVDLTTTLAACAEHLQIQQVFKITLQLTRTAKAHTVTLRSIEDGRITVCKPRKLLLAHGDRLQLKANRRLESGAAATNGEIVTVECVHEDGRIALRDGRTLDPSYREFRHGYAVTSYGSQGKTVDYVLFSDSAVRAATNSRQWYVTISRGRHGIRIFTPDKAALRENVLRSGDSPLALDLVDETSAIRARQPGARWQRWTRGWGPRVRSWLARVRTQRRNAPAQTMSYGHQTT